MNFQQLGIKLSSYWEQAGCLIAQPYNQPVGAGTMNPATYLRALGPEPWNVAYLEPSVRPDDGRYGENPNRLYTHTQFQVILKPTPERSQELYLDSLKAVGIDPVRNDIRFVEDNWAQPAIGAWGLGWEVWLNGLEITQYTYFQQVGGVALDPIPLEITYGLERIAMAQQRVNSVYDLMWDDVRTFGDIKRQDEVERSRFAFELSNIDNQQKMFGLLEAECADLVAKGCIAPAHDMVLQLSNIFNILDTRGAVGVTERQHLLGRIRDLAKAAANAYIAQRTEMGFPWRAKPHRVLWTPPTAARAQSTRQRPGAHAGTVLLEIGVEELPARHVASAMQQIEAAAPRLLKEARLAHGQIRVLATPRRLALIVRNVAPAQTPMETTIKGPSLKEGLDALGKPTPAAQAFARRVGVEVEDLQVRSGDKQNYLYVTKREPGRPTHEVLPDLFQALIREITFDKAMRWNASGTEFARPLQWLVALYDDHPISFEYAGVRSDTLSFGPRGAGSPQFDVIDASLYESQLREIGVIADPQQRKDEITCQINAAAARAGAVIEADDELLDEVTNLVEQPRALLCGFDPQFLQMPPAVLTKVMRSKQRYFTLRDAASGAMLPNFITVHNGPEGNDDVIVSGNEQVVRARFADAAYFYRKDLEIPLHTLRGKLGSLTFQARLGSMADKSDRVARLVQDMAPLFGLTSGETQVAFEAAGLCKSDLVTKLVVEMTSLHGIMGREYLRKQGGSPAVAEAIYEHVLPRFAGDQVAITRPGIVTAIADRLDSIMGLFAVGLMQKATADPFGLRRAAIGIVQTLVENRCSFSIDLALRMAARNLPVPVTEEMIRAAVLFMEDRLRAHLADRGIRADVVNAVLATCSDNPAQAFVRARDAMVLMQDPEWPRMLSTHQRCARLAQPGWPLASLTDTAPESMVLFDVLSRMPVPSDVAQLGACLKELIEPVARFMEAVLVNVPDPLIRRERQALLTGVQALSANMLDLGRIAS